MSLTSAMATLLAQMIAGEATTDFTAATWVGVGDSSATTNQGPPNTNTDLLGTNKLRKQVGGAPSRSGAQLTYVATFGLTEGNWAGGWQEWGLFNASSGGTMLNRKVENLGVKPSNQVWQLTAQVTVTAA
ncbi:MAG TPA: hypothetical protein VFX80_02400 [Solirubrobacteraceae bacterium]|nr:hypothetical protein [Solirubrobacteraceae bacterium]